MNPHELLRGKIRSVPDFPKPGIVFRDITPLLQDPEALRIACELLGEPFKGRGIDMVVGVESRGFIFGPPVALQLGAGFAIARKAGKLPWDTVSESFELEYGVEQIEMHRDAVSPEQRVLLIDDVIATGGTAAATAELVRRMGAQVVGSCFLIELSFLEGRKRLPGIDIRAVLSF
ncbi:MAG: adenine phosphoribosyltransferase [Deltaproteobacteria bacterium]|nr:adenine phosphoribosyltransferase [Deltaproteobacteria bacterium]